MISIIVPIYNVEHYLSPCLDSILNQSFTDFELILVDDGSTDGSEQICDEYASVDSRIKVIHQENAGISEARNKGQDCAQGDFLYFMDGDDQIHPQLLEILYNAIISDDYDFSMIYGIPVPDDFSIYEYPKKKVVSKGIVIDRDYCMKKLYGPVPIRTWYRTVWTKLYRRDFVKDLYSRKTASQDTEYNNRVYVRMNKAILIEEELYYWIQRPTSITHSEFNNRTIDFINSHVLCLSEIPESERTLRGYCLKALYKTMLLTCYNSRQTPYKEAAYQCVNDVHRRFKSEFIKSQIDWKEKLAYLSLYYLPGLLVAYMKYRELLTRK